MPVVKLPYLVSIGLEFLSTTSFLVHNIGMHVGVSAPKLLMATLVMCDIGFWDLVFFRYDNSSLCSVSVSILFGIDIDI